MPIQGVKGNVFELLLSTDKKVQDFMESLMPGDSLKGRVVEIMPADNKAIINFKGYNLVSQLPQDSVIQKGDIINVTVSQMDNRIFMKISAEALGKSAGLEAAGQNIMTPQQLIQILEDLKIPVNEQNIFIAQKLIDYHLPVTKENVAGINSSLNSYLQNRGIDPKAFSIDSIATARELVFSNFFRLGAELQKAAASLRNMAQVMQSTGQQILTRDDMAIRSLNTLNILNTAAAASAGSVGLSSDGSSMVLTLNNPDAQALKTVLDAAVKEGVITQQQAADALKSLEAPAASVTVGKDITINKQGFKVDIKYQGIPQLIDSLTSQPGGQAVSSLKEALANKLFDAKAISGVVSQADVKQDITAMLSTGAKALVAQARDTFSALSRNVLIPQNTNLQDNARETLRLMQALESTIADLVKQGEALNPKISDPEWAAVNNFKSGIAWSANALSSAVRNLNISGPDGQLNITPGDYGRYQSIMKEFMSKVAGLELFKPAESTLSQAAAQPGALPAANPAQVNLPMDVESTIDALVFLKSRDLSLDNSRLVDIMSSYFKNDMKLNRSIDSLSSALTGLENALKPARNTQPAVRELGLSAAGLKNIINDLTVKTNDSSLKAGIIEDQFRNFIEKSGLNLENKLMNMISAASTGPVSNRTLAEQPGAAVLAQLQDAPNINKANMAPDALNETGLVDTGKTYGVQSPQAAAHTLPAGPASNDNLKSRLVEFLGKLSAIDDTKMTSQQKQGIKQAREAANDIMTNLNALQLMNQKPVTFDMAYTQIPVFFNNKLFNGELQVWYRKGAPKEDLKNGSVPINMVFMLNTSNLGAIKVSMTVYKNEVECTVRAGTEKAKQALMRNKNEFLGTLEGLNYAVKNFNIQLEDDGQVAPPSSGEGYINVGRINLQA